MAVKKNPKSDRPVDVKPTEPQPRQPRRRASRLLRGPNAARSRLRVEQALRPQEALEDEMLLRLDQNEREMVQRIVRDPSAVDVPFQREAVSALGVFGDPGSVILLAELLSDSRQDPVLVGRAADAMERLGGAEAARAIGRALDHPDEYAKDRAARALCRLGHPDSARALTEIARSNPSEHLRDGARDALRRLGIAAPVSRYKRRSPVARKDRIARDR